MLFGYVRVSSRDQNEARQVKKMLDLGIDEENIYIDKQSGKNFDRPKYQEMRRFVREGDLIYVDALDRLGRSYDSVIKEWKYITRELNADIVCLDNQTLFDSRKFKEMKDLGKLMEDQFLSLLSYVAEQERKKIKQRQAEGIAVAKAQGKTLGRPKIEYPLSWDEVYCLWKNNKITAVEAMSRLNLKKNSFYNLIKKYEEKDTTE